MAILILQHSDLGTAGRLAATLRDHGQDTDVRRLDLPLDGGGDSVPTDFDDVDAVVSLGGPANVGDGLPWMDHEIEFLREAHGRHLPVFGICLGAQLIAKALGGEVGPLDAPEYGFCQVDQTNFGQTDRILAGIPWTSRMFQVHGHEVKTLPPGAMLLQTGKTCKVQSFCAGVRTYAVQYHPECDLAMIRAFAARHASNFAAVGIDQAAFDAQIEKDYASFVRLTDRLFVNLVTFLLPVTRRIVA